MERLLGFAWDGLIQQAQDGEERLSYCLCRQPLLLGVGRLALLSFGVIHNSMDSWVRVSYSLCLTVVDIAMMIGQLHCQMGSKNVKVFSLHSW